MSSEQTIERGYVDRRHDVEKMGVKIDSVPDFSSDFLGIWTREGRIVKSGFDGRALAFLLACPQEPTVKLRSAGFRPRQVERGISPWSGHFILTGPTVDYT